MKVNAGKYKNLVLKTSALSSTRQTLSRIKIDIFNILKNYFIFENKVCLDLFAGSGSLGIEALSFGVKKTIFNDNNYEIFNLLKSNLRKIDSSNYEIYNYDYLTLLKTVKSKQLKLDLVFLDPPYMLKDYYYNSLNKLLEFDLLEKWSIIVVETENSLDLSQCTNFKLLKLKTFKNKQIYFFRLEE